MPAILDVPPPNTAVACRNKRIDALNTVLEANKKARASSTPYSSVKWSDVQLIFNPVTTPCGVASNLAMDVGAFQSLLQNLNSMTRILGPVVNGKETKRVLFIAPILIAVAAEMDNIEILIEEEVIGSYVRAHGHFEFVVKRGNQQICIVEAKKEDFEQGQAQALVGIEVLAEKEDLHVVHCVVTNYIEWRFLRSEDERILLHSTAISSNNDGTPVEAALQTIVNTLCSILRGDNIFV